LFSTFYFFFNMVWLRKLKSLIEPEVSWGSIINFRFFVNLLVPCGIFSPICENSIVLTLLINRLLMLNLFACKSISCVYFLHEKIQIRLSEIEIQLALIFISHAASRWVKSSAKCSFNISCGSSSHHLVQCEHLQRILCEIN